MIVIFGNVGVGFNGTRLLEKEQASAGTRAEGDKCFGSGLLNPVSTF